jgi:catalase
VLVVAPSPALQLIGKMKDTLEGRCVALLVSAGSDAKTVSAIRAAVLKAGATAKVVAPKIGELLLSDGKPIAVDGQLAGTPSVFFDAVAVLLSDDGAKALAGEAAAVDFVRDAYGHLKAICVDAGGQALLQKAGLMPDEGVMAASDTAAFIRTAKTRLWGREPQVRTLA